MDPREVLLREISVLQTGEGGTLIRVPSAFSAELVEHLVRDGFCPTPTVGTSSYDEVSVDRTVEETWKSVTRFGKALLVDDHLTAWARSVR